MSAVTPFRGKRKTYASPHDLLRDMARIDATLVYELRADNVFIGFEAPQRHHAEFHSILSMLDHCGETWRFRYYCAVADLLGHDKPGKEPQHGKPVHLRLRRAFLDGAPSRGADAFRLLTILNDDLKTLEDEEPDEDWLCARNRRNDLLLYMQTMAGTLYGQEAAAEAKRWAVERGIMVETIPGDGGAA